MAKVALITESTRYIKTISLPIINLMILVGLIKE